MNMGRAIALAILLCNFYTPVFALVSDAASQTNKDLHDNVFDIDKLAEQLKKDGLEGSVHGVASDLGQYVFTVRDATDFFKHLEISLFTRLPDVKKKLAALKRHDKVKIKGEFVKNPSAQPHIKVTDVTVTTEFKDPEREKHARYTHTTVVADALKGKTEIEAVVHAVAREGKVLVVEYGDAVIPVAMTDGTLTEKLGRGDKVRLKFKKQSYPRSPTHIELDEDAKTPIELIEKKSLAESAGDDIEIEGDLIYFPKSPQINVPVFAIRVVDANGTSRNFTLLGTPEVFKEVREHCLKVWKSNDSTEEQGRNFLVNPKLKAKAKGTLGYDDRSQANPQVYLEKLEDIELTYDGKPAK